MGLKRKNNPDYHLVMGADGRRYWKKKDQTPKVDMKGVDVDCIMGMVNQGGLSIPERSLNDIDGCIVHEGQLSADGTYSVPPSLEIYDEGQFADSVMTLMGANMDSFSSDDKDEVNVAMNVQWEPIIVSDSDGEYCDGFVMPKNAVNPQERDIIMQKLAQSMNNNSDIMNFKSTKVNDGMTIGNVNHGMYGILPTVSMKNSEEFTKEFWDNCGIEESDIMPDVKGQIDAIVSSEHSWKACISNVDDRTEELTGFSLKNEHVDMINTLLGEDAIPYDICSVDREEFDYDKKMYEFLVKEENDLRVSGDPEGAYVDTGPYGDYSRLEINEVDMVRFADDLEFYNDIPELMLMSPHVRDAFVREVSNEYMWEPEYSNFPYSEPILSGFTMENYSFDGSINSAIKETYGEESHQRHFHSGQ